MSYYLSDYRNPPDAYPPSGSSRWTEPGWGVLPIAAGPARLAVGAIAMRPRLVARGVTLEELREEQAGRAEPAVPWWVWVAVPGVLAGGAALALNMGWIGGP